MRVFGCAACPSKDAEIVWLRNRVEALEKDVLAVADKRAASLRNPPEAGPQLPPPPMGYGQARAMVYDPSMVADPLPEGPTREDIERGFASGPPDSAKGE